MSSLVTRTSDPISPNEGPKNDTPAFHTHKRYRSSPLRETGPASGGGASDWGGGFATYSLCSSVKPTLMVT